MPLPLWPLKTVYAPGQDESTLGDDMKTVAEGMGIKTVPDPLPDRNVFIRTDQFSFVRQGVPALVFKFGYAKGTPEFDIEHDWRANRYHSPSDDLQQPMLKDEAVKLDSLVAGIAARVANADGPAALDAGQCLQRLCEVGPTQRTKKNRRVLAGAAEFYCSSLAWLALLAGTFPLSGYRRAARCTSLKRASSRLAVA